MLPIYRFNPSQDFGRPWRTSHCGRDGSEGSAPRSAGMAWSYYTAGEFVEGWILYSGGMEKKMDATILLGTVLR